MNITVNLSKLATRVTSWPVWIGLAILLIANVPLFLCMRLNGDATYYDLQLQCIQEGGVAYRDMVEPNLPGAIWVHAAVRAVAGWSSVALRAFDLLVLGGVVALLLAYLRRRLDSSLSGPLLALCVCWFYLSLSAWSHCQRDLWMLLPSLGALWIHGRRVGIARVKGNEDDSTDSSAVMANENDGIPRSFIWGLVEGALWATAFWLKPHVAIPALFVLLTSLRITGISRTSLLGVAGVLCGGVVVGIAGSSWLVATGAWPYFWEMQLQWNPEYLESRANWDLMERYAGLFQSFSPWSWAHLVAIPVAVLCIVGTFFPGCRSRVLRGSSDAWGIGEPQLLCAVYLGWFAQSVWLQHPFSYCHVPGVILAMAVVASIRWPLRWAMIPRAVTCAVLLIACLLSPCTNLKRLGNWDECVTRGPSLASRVAFQARPGPYWVYYPALVQFFREADVDGQDVLVYSSPLISLYTDLELRPPLRYVLPDVHRVFFRSRVPLMREAIETAGHRYVVSDLRSLGLRHDDLATIDPETDLPTAYPEHLRDRFPATQPVVFRSGWFVVHQARGAAGF